MARLSIIIPTLGRPTLERTLASCSGADEIVVVLDTARGAVSLPCELPPNAVVIEGSWGITGGHGGRQEGIRRATGTHLAFFDDDDEYTPGAIELMRGVACERPVIFRMDHYAHGVLWRDRQVRFGNVSTQMYVVPNGELGSWTPHAPGLKEPGGDYTFMAETVSKLGDPVWREEIIAVIRPELHRPSISIVTPWHNHRELATQYFMAVGQRLSGDELLVVDNNSDPPLPFGTLQVGENLGFSGGCNLGLEAASRDAVLFLNNDIRMLDPHWLRGIREALEPGVIVGPLRFDNHSKVDEQSLPYVDGWCLAGMREDLLELGGFADLEEPAYYSDNLLCLEARAHGMTLRHVDVGLQHLENVTAGNQFTPSVQAAATANRARYEARARELLAAV